MVKKMSLPHSFLVVSLRLLR